MSVVRPQSDTPDQGRSGSVDSAVGQELSLPAQDPAALNTNSPYRFHHDIFVTSTEEVRGAQQSPPTYHRVPTSSQVALDSRSFAELETPPYRSRTNLGERDEKPGDCPMPEGRVTDEKVPLKGVHYPSDLDSPHVHHPAIIRVDSDAPSVAGTDEDYEEDSDYDWSGEEDLVEEETKFEEQMGKKTKRKGWGPKRYAYNPTLITSILPTDKHPTSGLSPSSFPPSSVPCSSLACSLLGRLSSTSIGTRRILPNNDVILSTTLKLGCSGLLLILSFRGGWRS